MSPIGPGGESVGVELFTASSVDARWGRAIWGATEWNEASWEEVNCEVVEANFQWGAQSEAGVLSVPDAGAMDLKTYDPLRLLDPLATTSRFFGSVKPGTPVRIVGKVGAQVIPAWSGFLDEGTYELTSAQGNLRAIDGIAYLAQAEVAEGVVLPNTLRARVRAVVNAVGLAAVVPVQPEQTIIELVTGGGFEGSLDPKWVPNSVGAGSGSVVEPTAVEGTRVLKVVGAAGGSSYRQVIASPPVPGATYTIHGLVGRPAGAGAGNGSVVVRGKNEAGTLVGPITTLTGISTGGSWDILDGTWVCPSDGSIETLEVWCQGTTAAADTPIFDTISVTGPDPDRILAADPPVAAHDGKRQSAWTIIQNAALDALTFVWLGPTGLLRFTPWGSLRDADYSLGCQPSDETGGVWIEGVTSLESAIRADGIRNSIRAYTTGTTFSAPVTDPNSIRLYGERRLDAERIVPNFSTWAGRILADRAGSGLEVALGEIRPATALELGFLLEGDIDGPSALRVHDEAHGEEVDLIVAAIGGRVGITGNGWRFSFVTSIPRAEWEEAQPPPRPPPIPPVAPWHVETRNYTATSDALLALTSGGAKYGAGGSSTLPVGTWSGWTYRSLIQFPGIPWTKVRAIRSATIILKTSTQVRIGFGSSPTIELKRITGSWSAGSSSSPGSNGGNVVWPGPATTGSVRSNISGSQGATARVGVTALVKPWAPVAVGGTLQPQRGLALYPGSGSGADTTEFWPVEKGGSDRPVLELVLEIFD